MSAVHDCKLPSSYFFLNTLSDFFFTTPELNLIKKVVLGEERGAGIMLHAITAAHNTNKRIQSRFEKTQKKNSKL